MPAARAPFENALQRPTGGRHVREHPVSLLVGDAAARRHLSLFGITIFTQPGVSLATLMLLFGAFVLVDGIGTVITAVGGRSELEPWWVLLLAGLAGIGVGLLTFYNPAITALTLQLLIAMWAVSTGLLQIVAAIRLRKEIQVSLARGLGLLSVASACSWSPGPSRVRSRCSGTSAATRSCSASP